MTSENSIYDKFSLIDAPKKLRSAKDVAKNVPRELHGLCDYIADIIEANNITLVTPYILIDILAQTQADLASESCCHTKNVTLPETLKIEKTQIAFYLRYFPLIIDKIANKDFSDTFRKLFIRLFGEAEPPESTIKEDFGVTILRKNKVDISSKDKAEVLASLYNNSHPQGLGFLHYDKEPLTIQKAREILKRTTHFDYLAGRIMNIDLSTHIVYTGLYNRDNGDGAAERAISQCHNINLSIA